MNTNCSACPLNGTAINIVQAEGPSPCDVMLVGEAPGSAENESGLPFQGAAGQLLNKLLPSAGLKREDCRIDNVIHCRPPDNKLVKGRKQILECCTPQLLDEIESVNPKLIILLGATAINFFFPNEKMRQCHGLIRERDGRKFALMYHPAAALHAPRTGNDLIQDFKNLPFALRGFSSGGANQQGVTQDYKVIGPGEDATEIVQEIYEDARVSGKLAFDTETTSVDARTCELLGFSVCAQPGKAYYFTDFGWMHYLHERLGNTVDYVQHNAKYDLMIAKRQGIILEPFLDTMVAAYVLRDGHLGLKELAQYRLNQPMNTLEELFGKKALKDMGSLPLEKLGVYACLSGESRILTRTGYKRLQQIVKSKSTEEVLSMTTEGTLVWRPITNWYRNVHRHPIEWWSIETEHTRLGRTNYTQKFSGIGTRYTADHKLLTKRGWVAISNITEDDYIALPTKKLTTVQRQIAIGSALGDGDFPRRNSGGWACLRLTHGEKQKDYLQWKADLFGCGTITKQSDAKKYIICGKSVKKSAIYSVTSDAHPELGDFRPTAQGRLGDWIEELNALALAILYQDDGTLIEGKYARIYTQSFSDEEITKLQSVLSQKFNIETTRYHPDATKVQWAIHIKATSGMNFFSLIAPFVHPCVQYKLPECWRDKFNPVLPNEPSGPVFSKVRRVFYNPKPPTQRGTTYISYCIDVADTHNFVTYNEVAHNCRDADMTLRLWYNLEPQLKVENAEKVYYDIDIPLIPVLVDMEATGVNIDITRAEKLDVELGVELLHATERIWTAAGKTFNINAPAQLGEILFERIGLPVISKTPSGAPSTDDEVLQDLKGRHPIVGDVLRYRALSKLVSTYVHKLPELIAPDTGRIHPDWNNCSTTTGRLCVHPDTPIEAPRDLTKYPDGIPLRELKVGDWVYSYDWDKHLVLKKVLWVGPTAVKPTLVIKLKGEWGQQTTLRVSHDHLVRMFAGHWLPAGKLKVGNRLCCMVRRGIDGWASFFPSSKRRVRGESGGKAKEHRVVYALTHSMTSLPTQWDVHHKDGNKLNNHPNNLEFVYHPSHLAMHRKNTTKEEVIKMLSGESPMTICKQVLYRKAREYGLVPPGRQERNPKEKVMRMLSGEDPVTVHPRTLKNLARKYNLTAVNHTVVSIEEGPTEQLWDLEIEDTHTFIGSDVALHNSCSSPNAQNIPARTEEGAQVRSIFSAPDGCYIVAPDYSQIELRLLAHFSQDPNMLQTFRSGGDIHTATAARLHGIKTEDVTKQQRYLSKTLNFGMSYGMSAYGLMANTPDLKLDKHQAAKFIEAFFNAFPGIREYIKRTETKALLLNYVETLLGRRRSIATNILDKRGREAALREAINSPIQGSAADLIKMAMIKVYSGLKKRQMKSRLVMQVHDELVFEVPEDELSEAVELIKECMVDVIPLSVPLPVDIEIGKNWKELYAI